MPRNETTKKVNVGYDGGFPSEEEELFSTKDFLEGYLPDSDPLTLPDNALSYTKNVEFLRRMCFRRNGLLEYSNTKPNSNKVLNIVAFYDPTTGLNVVRFDREKIYRAQSSGWTEFTPNGIAGISGQDTDYFTIAVIQNRVFFTNNGVDDIREIISSTDTYEALGNAPRYKYITAAFDRVIGAFSTGVSNDPTEWGWSGNRNYGEWDPLVDKSAGSNNLVASPSAISDDITGLFSNANSLIIPRQRSMWLASHIDSATNPFIPYAAIPRIGADLPRTIFLSDFGLIWTSFQSSCIYVWDLVSNVPEIISLKISRTLKNSLQQAEEIWASYSYDTKKYSLFISISGDSTVQCFTYDFVYKNWVYQEYPLVSTVSDLDFAATTTTIDELVGSISGLTGTIESLGGIVGDSTRFFGHMDGEMSTYTFFSGAEDSSNITQEDLGTAFTHDIRSKETELPISESFVNLVLFKYVPYTEGTLVMQVSKDSGKTWTTIKTQAVDSSKLNQNLEFQLRKAIKAKSVIWRLTSENCMMSHNGLSVKFIQAGVTKNGN